jgi:integrase
LVRVSWARSFVPVTNALALLVRLTAPDGISICNRNRILTGVKFLLRVTLRRLDLVAEVYHLHEPQTVPQVMSPDETRRVLAVAMSLKARVMLSLGYGCGLRAGEVVRLKVKHIDSAQKIIRMLPRSRTVGLSRARPQRRGLAEGRSAFAIRRVKTTARPE